MKRVQVAAITGLGTPVIAALGSSLSWKVEGLDHLHFEGNGRRPIMAFWHGRVLTATYFFRDRGIVVMISENFDGEWIARIIERFGFRTSRGSTSRGGQRALLQLKRDMEQGLAKLTGNPVVPFHMEASSYWSLKSWDRTQIPRPFSTVALVVGAPMEVPADADESLLEAKRVELEESLFALERRALALLANSQPSALSPQP
jgi:lysophospholipid acyltransferase (LPLAT)-like uncharacterized protein